MDEDYGAIPMFGEHVCRIRTWESKWMRMQKLVNEQ